MGDRVKKITFKFHNFGLVIDHFGNDFRLSLLAEKVKFFKINSWAQ